MKKPKLTPWFSGDVKPVREGFYEREYSSPEVTVPDRWDGQRWILVSSDGSDMNLASTQNRRWRGLAVKP